MRELQDREALLQYLCKFQLEQVFHEQVVPYLSLCSFEQGEIICSQGETAQYLYVLVKGKMKIYNSSAEGKTLILSFRTPLEVIGDIEYVQNIPIINTVEAISPVVMIGVHHRSLNKFSRDHSPFLQFLLDIITRKFHVKSNTLSQNVMYPAEVRLASYLLSMSIDESDVLFEGQLSSGSLGDVANLIGVSYRHMNRVIRSFCQEGLVERRKGQILVKNREGLARLASRNIYE